VFCFLGYVVRSLQPPWSSCSYAVNSALSSLWIFVIIREFFNYNVCIVVQLAVLFVVCWIGIEALRGIWARPLQERLQLIFTAILMFAFPVPLYLDMAPHFMLVWKGMTWGIGASCAIHAAKASLQNSSEMKKLAANAAPMTDIKVAPVANE
jgi:hypothetical protein